MSWQSCPDAMFKYSRLSAQFRAIKYIHGGNAALTTILFQNFLVISSRNHYPLDNSPWPLFFQTLEASSILSGFYEFSHCLSMYSQTIFACMHVCMCVLNACVYMWSEINIKCLITSFFTLFKNKASPGDPKLALLARLTSQRAPGILLSLPFLPLFPTVL